MSSAAERQRRSRQRRRAGLLFVGINVTFEFVDHLVDVGELEAWDTADPAEIGKAIEAVHAAMVVTCDAADVAGMVTPLTITNSQMGK